MATSTIKNITVRRADYTFYLANYTLYSSYYVSIPNYKSIVGIPADAKILGATIAGWGNLGTNPFSIGLDDNTLYAIIPNGQAIQANTTITVRFAYITY